MEGDLHPWVALVVVPVFAFFNAGVRIDAVSVGALSTGIAFGTIAVLFLGKQIGIFGAVWLAVRCGMARLPSRVTWAQLYGVSILAGIGFTMSLFVGSLAFVDVERANASKLAVVFASVISALAGLVVLRFAAWAHARRTRSHHAARIG